jgi:hypothetical protein
VRIIRLNDGRNCYLRPARPKIVVPPGQTLAFASFIGVRRFPIRVPEFWEGMHEADLRKHVEEGLEAKGMPIPMSAAEPMPRAAAKKKVSRFAG